jgi:putative tryptophan/tyrosine transport system substrate-binding protein
MRRRDFITLLGGAAASWPMAARAQTPVIGFLHSASAEGYSPYVAAFREGLKEAGFVENQNVAIEYRWADGRYDRLQDLLNDLLSRQVAVIVAAPAPAAAIAKQATKTVPVVFEGGADPVRLGLVTSLKRPGSNITGIVNLSNAVIGKRLELAHEIAPSAGSIAILLNPDNPISGSEADDARAAEQLLKIKIQLLQVRNINDVNTSFAKLREMQADALVIGADAYLTSLWRECALLAARYGIPTIGEDRAFATAGGLMSYGADLGNAYYLTGTYTGRILKGEKAADMPVQQSTIIRMVLNLKAANALGLTVPLPLLARADEVIE